MESRDQVLGGTYFFDSKPVIMKPWSQDMDFSERGVENYSHMDTLEVRV